MNQDDYKELVDTQQGKKKRAEDLDDVMSEIALSPLMDVHPLPFFLLPQAD